jgi:hypothetical protein
MVVEIKEIKKAWIPDEDPPRWLSDLHVYMKRLELICLLSFQVRGWMGDPKELLMKLDTLLGEIQEANPIWREKVREFIQMI